MNRETLKQDIKTLKDAKQLIIESISELPKVEEGEHFYKSIQHLNSYIMQLDEELQNKNFCKWCSDEIESDYKPKFCSKLCYTDYHNE